MVSLPIAVPPANTMNRVSMKAPFLPTLAAGRREPEIQSSTRRLRL